MEVVVEGSLFTRSTTTVSLTLTLIKVRLTVNWSAVHIEPVPVDGGGGGGELVDQVHHHSVSGAHAYGGPRQQPACIWVSVQEHGIIFCQISLVPLKMRHSLCSQIYVLSVKHVFVTFFIYKIWLRQHVEAASTVVKMSEKFYTVPMPLISSDNVHLNIFIQYLCP